jgi:hypothetical protein
MKYMTPALIARFRSPDETTADEAAAEWERSCEGYREHLKRILPNLPRGARRLWQRYLLSDAKVLSMAADEVPSLSMFLELNKPADPLDRFLELRYRLAGGVKRGIRLDQHPALRGDGRPLGWWLYDEFDLDESSQVGTHSILLTGSYEVQIDFFTMSCRRVQFVLPPAGVIGEDQEPKALTA